MTLVIMTLEFLCFPCVLTVRNRGKELNISMMILSRNVSIVEELYLGQKSEKYDI